MRAAVDTACMSGPAESDPRVEALLKAARAGAAQPLRRRDRISETIVAVLFAAAVALLAAVSRQPGTLDPGLAALLVAALVVAKRIGFSIGAGSASPTQALLVPMLLLLPPATVPVLVVVALLLARVPEYLRRTVHPDHAVLHAGDAWFVVAPALVIALAAPGAPSLAHWRVYALALAAQLVADGASATAREWLASGTAPRLQLRLLGLVFAVDVSLAPIGLLVALSARTHPGAALLVLPLLGLLAVLGREREQRIEHALALSEAYRGSALLMGEMLEADDPYTGGEHTRGVVALALAVGGELRLDAREQRDLEFASLLHDIGKLRVPEEILNKPGPLTPAEWAVIRRHPQDGQRMLERIGGVLADVGVAVRAHHERWDGAGYPDGLAGERIPLAARIVCACDAFNAMTTDRAYRRAMPEADALCELEACAGSQFDPRVVAAIMAVVGRARPAPIAATLAA